MSMPIPTEFIPGISTGYAKKLSDNEINSVQDLALADISNIHIAGISEEKLLQFKKAAQEYVTDLETMINELSSNDKSELEARMPNWDNIKASVPCFQPRIQYTHQEELVKLGFNYAEISELYSTRPEEDIELLIEQAEEASQEAARDKFEILRNDGNGPDNE